MTFTQLNQQVLLFYEVDMPLNWSIKQVENFGELVVENQLNPVTHEIIWAGYALGMNKVTADNINEWLVRLQLAKAVGHNIDVEISPSDLKRHIGLTTNVTSTTRSKFVKGITERLVEQAEDWAKRVTD